MAYADPPPEQWPAGRLLSTAARLVEHAWNAHLAEHGLTHAGVLVLHLLGDGPLSQQALATASQVEAQTMSRTLDRLERTGHVRRTRDTTDRRRVLVSRTARGTRVLRGATATATADRLVLEGLADPDAFRRDLVAIIARLGGDRWPRPT